MYRKVKKKKRDAGKRRKTEVHFKRCNVKTIKYITDIIFIFSPIDIHFMFRTKIYMRIRF